MDDEAGQAEPVGGLPRRLVTRVRVYAETGDEHQHKGEEPEEEAVGQRRCQLSSGERPIEQQDVPHDGDRPPIAVASLEQETGLVRPCAKFPNAGADTGAGLGRLVGGFFLVHAHRLRRTR